MRIRAREKYTINQFILDLMIEISQRMNEFFIMLKNPSLSGITLRPCLTQENGMEYQPRRLFVD